MVRLEKILAERVVLGTTRLQALGAPRKWFYANPY